MPFFVLIKFVVYPKNKKIKELNSIHHVHVKIWPGYLFKCNFFPPSDNIALYSLPFPVERFQNPFIFPKFILQRSIINIYFPCSGDC